MREVRTFVRYGGRVVELTASGPLIVGRGEACDVVLDDDLASRQHCRLELVGDAVRLTDLGSRNGVLVNGLPVEGEQDVHHGDLITAGRSQLEVARQEHQPRLEPLHDEDDDERAVSSADLTATGSVYEILSGSARNSLAGGDVPTAERSARNLFSAIKSSLARGRAVGPATFDEAVELALRLADATADAGWVDRVLEIHVAAQKTMPVTLAERLAEATRAADGTLRAAAEYVALARASDDPSADVLARFSA